MDTPPGTTAVQAAAFVNRLLERLGWNDARFQAYLIGSVASGDNDADSDLDVLIVGEALPDASQRSEAYERAGCRRAMIDFYVRGAAVFPANVTAVDKLWIDGTQIDFSFATPHEAQAYDLQYRLAIGRSPPMQALEPRRERAPATPAEIARRVRYNLRIMHVHRDRYARWCKRSRWLCIDPSWFLLAARDLVLMLEGCSSYHLADLHLWKVFAQINSGLPNLGAQLEDIRQLDDRTASAEKLRIMDAVVSALQSLWAARGVRPELYDIDS